MENPAFEIATVPAGTRFFGYRGMLIVAEPDPAPYALEIDASVWPPKVTRSTVLMTYECEDSADFAVGVIGQSDTAIT